MEEFLVKVTGEESHKSREMPQVVKLGWGRMAKQKELIGNLSRGSQNLTVPKTL